jgi:hypothetical protein
MATSQVNQKVYVSPGVYTSETDLSFVAQSVGVTTLGLVGETIKGPAFEPVFVTNYNEFQSYFGGAEPTKFVNTQIPKYETAYIAKSYLQQSNQLFVTRVLGLSGYDAGPSWSIKVNANVDSSTLVLDSSDTWSVDFTYDSNDGSLVFTSSLPSQISEKLNSQYRLVDGSSSTFFEDFQFIIDEAILSPSFSADTAVVYGSISESAIDDILDGGYSPLNLFGVNNLNLELNDLSSDENDPWFYSNFDNVSGNDYEGFSFDYVISDLVDEGEGEFSGILSGNIFEFVGSAYSEYNNMVIATLRSRGVTLYSTNQHGPQYQVPNVGDLTLVCDGEYSTSSQSPFEPFLVSGKTVNDNTFSFEVSLSPSSSKFITKVLGSDNFSKSRTEVPVYVEEVYSSSLSYAYNQGKIKGVSCDLIGLDSARSGDSDSIAYNVNKYQSPKTPFVVSELRGNKVFKLFRFFTISDGDSANFEVKVSIANISFNNMSFDVLVRNFFDTDANPVVIEKFTGCNMDPNSNNYIAKKIGSTDGEYALLSKFIMVEMADEAPVDALPCGFLGYTQREYGSLSNPSPKPVFKTKYNFPGEVILNPPFSSQFGGDNTVVSSGDIVRRTYLGFSSQFGIDGSLLTYKGRQNPFGWVQSPTPVEGDDWNVISKGFHMDSGATVVTVSNSYSTSGQSAFECGVAEFRSEPQDRDNPYYFIYSRKFTFCFAGGFDGWDIYREFRTNQDQFQIGASGYLNGSSPTTRYPNATGQGLFKRIVVQSNSQDFANTDYYAYLLGILTYSNPESTNINVFATPGIDYVNHSNLVEQAIDMVQFDRADSVYISTTPDYNMFTPDNTNPLDIINSQEAVGNLENSGIDSNYTSTYYPWILVRDTVNNTQVYIPPTGEVCRNLALTDNISFPWFASAGYTRGLVNSIKARVKLTQEDRDTLYQGRINPIATFSDVGTVIWGNKTLQVADTALNRLNVRRLLLQARKLISAVAVRLLFEQNDQIVRQQFLDSVNPILDSIRRDRGLYDFRVTVSSTPEDLDRNTLTGKIYLKPTKALEFIDIEFIITPTGASFENI